MTTHQEQTTLVIDPHFDPKTCRHSVNGWLAVLHCHHYATLYTQLADDCTMIDAKALLAEVAEDTFADVLCGYYAGHGIEDLAHRLTIAEKYFSAIGLGKMRVAYAGPDSAEVVLDHSHIDEGWIKKWGKRERPVNYVTCGYIAGMLAAAFGKPTRSFAAYETDSIVAGAPVSRFKAVAR